MAWIVILIIILPVAVMQLIGYSISEPGYKGPVSDHFNGKEFFNYGEKNTRNLWQVLQWMISRQRGPWIKINVPPGAPPLRLVSDRIRITHVNHSTFLIQCDNVNILTDPVWSERVSPFTSFGPKRMRPPGIRIEDLPQIHIVLISHNHYDHLDLSSLKELTSRHKPEFVVPLGVGALMKKHGMNDFSEIDWWHSLKTKSSITIQSLPAHHSTARGSVDRDKTLWCGFSISSRLGKIYFAGDTGYHSTTFKRIGNEAGPFLISIIPVGAYKPKWFMSPVHCDPAEAIEIHIAVQSQQSIASHFGTFPLGDDGQTEPLEDLVKARAKRGLGTSSFMIPQAGLPIDVGLETNS